MSDIILTDNADEFLDDDDNDSRIFGLGDDDTIYGAGGNDTIYGDGVGTGIDTSSITPYSGNSAADWEAAGATLKAKIVGSANLTTQADDIYDALLTPPPSAAELSKRADIINLINNYGLTGIGVGTNLGDTTNSGSANNQEVQLGSIGGSGNDYDALQIDLNRSAKVVDVSVSLFYSNEDVGGGKKDAEQLKYVLQKDNGNGTYTDVSGPITVTATGTGAFSGTNAGQYTFQVGDPNNANTPVFDTIKFLGAQYKSGNASTNGDVSDFLLSSVNIVQVASVGGIAGNDLINGGTGNDYVEGNQGNDTLSGGSGVDTLFGNEDNDKLAGDDGSDSIDGGTGNDTILGDLGNDTLVGGDGNDTIKGGLDNDSVTGGNGSDTIWGEKGNDNLLGGAGIDSLLGGDGNDKVDGGTEDDVLFGNAGNDTLLGGDGKDSLNGGDAKDSLNGGAGNDTMLGGNDKDILTGGTGDDLLRGESGDDYLVGSAGKDTLVGGLGNDTLIGGDSDPDLFVIGPNSGTDVIQGFDLDDGDKIGLSGGITFGQLTLNNDQILFGAQVLATINPIMASDLSASDFVSFT